MSHLLSSKKTEALDAAVAEASRNQRSTRPQEEEQTTPQERLWTAAEKGQLEALRDACTSTVDLDARRPADGLAALSLAMAPSVVALNLKESNCTNQGGDYSGLRRLCTAMSGGRATGLKELLLDQNELKVERLSLIHI